MEDYMYGPFNILFVEYQFCDLRILFFGPNCFKKLTFITLALSQRCHVVKTLVKNACSITLNSWG